jgi:hypothetical protein
MKRNSFAPDAYALGLAVFGLVLLVFPSLRVAGSISIILALVYSLLIAVLRLVRR